MTQCGANKNCNIHRKRHAITTHESNPTKGCIGKSNILPTLPAKKLNATSLVKYDNCVMFFNKKIYIHGPSEPFVPCKNAVKLRVWSTPNGYHLLCVELRLPYVYFVLHLQALIKFITQHQSVSRRRVKPSDRLPPNQTIKPYRIVTSLVVGCDSEKD